MLAQRSRRLRSRHPLRRVSWLLGLVVAAATGCNSDPPAPAPAPAPPSAPAPAPPAASAAVAHGQEFDGGAAMPQPGGPSPERTDPAGLNIAIPDPILPP